MIMGWFRMLITDRAGAAAIVMILASLGAVAYLALDPTQPYQETSAPVVTNERGESMAREGSAYLVAAGATVIVTRSFCLRRNMTVELQREFESADGLRYFVARGLIPESVLGGDGGCSTVRSLVPLPVYVPQGKWTENVWVDSWTTPLRHVRYRIQSIDFRVTPPKWESMTEELRAVFSEMQRRLDHNEASDRGHLLQTKILTSKVRDLQQQVDVLSGQVRRLGSTK